MTTLTRAGSVLVILGICAVPAPAQTTLASRVDALTNAITISAVESLFPDALLVEMITAESNYHARARIYHHHLKPLIPGSEEHFYDVLYAAFTITSPFFLNEADISEQDAEALQKWRATLLEIGKAYFSDSERLRSFYGAKKNLIISTVRGMSQSDRSRFLQQLTLFEQAARAYLRNSGRIRTAAQKVLIAEEDLAMRSDAPQDLQDALSAAESELYEAANTIVEPDNVSRTVDHAKFLSRRHNDGGNAIIKVWESITSDLLAELS
jgi:hypothetical protein